MEKPLFRKIDIESLQQKLMRNPEKIKFVTKMSSKTGGIRYDSVLVNRKIKKKLELVSSEADFMFKPIDS